MTAIYQHNNDQKIARKSSSLRAAAVAELVEAASA